MDFGVHKSIIDVNIEFIWYVNLYYKKPGVSGPGKLTVAIKQLMDSDSPTNKFFRTGLIYA